MQQSQCALHVTEFCFLSETIIEYEKNINTIVILISYRSNKKGLRIKIRLCVKNKSYISTIVASDDNLRKQFRHRSGPTKLRARPGSKLFVTLMVFLKEFLKKLILRKKIHQQTNKSMPDYLVVKELV